MIQSAAMVGRQKQPFVAVVDDDAGVRKAIQNVLRSDGLQSRGYSSGEEFLRSGTGLRAGCLVLDVHLRGMSGHALYRHLQDKGSRMAVIFVTAGQPSAQLLQAGALAVLTKPFDPSELLRLVRSALAAHSLPPP
jgi:FixJ family two-component response regulator